MFLLNGWSPLIIWVSIIIGFICVVIIPRILIHDIVSSPIGILISVLSGLMIVIGTPIGVHVEYAKVLSNLETQEKLAVSQFIKNGILTVTDQGSDVVYPDMRDVYVLMANGDTKIYYYSLKTKKAIPFIV